MKVPLDSSVAAGSEAVETPVSPAVVLDLVPWSSVGLVGSDKCT